MNLPKFLAILKHYIKICILPKFTGKIFFTGFNRLLPRYGKNSPFPTLCPSETNVNFCGKYQPETTHRCTIPLPSKQQATTTTPAIGARGESGVKHRVSHGYCFYSVWIKWVFMLTVSNILFILSYSSIIPKYQNDHCHLTKTVSLIRNEVKLS